MMSRCNVVWCRGVASYGVEMLYRIVWRCVTNCASCLPRLEAIVQVTVTAVLVCAVLAV